VQSNYWWRLFRLFSLLIHFYVANIDTSPSTSLAH